MSLKDELVKRLAGTPYTGLTINKEADYKGRKGTEIAFVSQGIAFSTIITDDLGLDNFEKAALVNINFKKALKNKEFEDETR